MPLPTHVHAADPRPIATAYPPPYQPPEASIASRGISLHSKGNVRGTTLTNGPIRRRVAFESGLELKAIEVFLARPDVVDIEEQVGPIAFVDGLGRRCERVFDLRVTLTDGSRILVSVKPEDKALGIDLDGENRTIAAQIDPAIADRIVRVSERHLPREVVRDAQLVRMVRRDRRPDVDRVLAGIVASLQGETTVGELVRSSGLKGAAFRGVVRLVGCGTLRIVGPRGIDYATRVEPSSVTGAT